MVAVNPFPSLLPPLLKKIMDVCGVGDGGAGGEDMMGCGVGHDVVVGVVDCVVCGCGGWIVVFCSEVP